MTMTDERTLEIGGRTIGGGAPAFVIAELGSNHDGSLDQAKTLIDVAADAGCDAVKIQIPIADECYPPGTRFGGIYGDKDISEVIRGNEIPETWVPVLVAHGHERGLAVGASADGFIGLDIMVRGGVDFIKIPSFTISHIPLLRRAAAGRLPVLFSTGSHSLGAVEEAVDALSPQVPGLFHCVSAYPAPPESLNLATQPFLKQAFGLPTGFSDHSTDPVRAPALAAALGADLLEKHYTLSRELEGTDHFFALEPGELADMVAAVRRVEADPAVRRAVLDDPANGPLLGSVRRGILEAEEPFNKRTRLGLYFRRALDAGAVVGEDDVRVYRCADTTPGLHPRHLDVIRGARLTRRAEAYAAVEWSHVIDAPGAAKAGD